MFQDDLETPSYVNVSYPAGGEISDETPPPLPLRTTSKAPPTGGPSRQLFHRKNGRLVSEQDEVGSSSNAQSGEQYVLQQRRRSEEISRMPAVSSHRDRHGSSVSGGDPEPTAPFQTRHNTSSTSGLGSGGVSLYRHVQFHVEKLTLFCDFDRVF